jgi:type I restriction enzyme, R subunit
LSNRGKYCNNIEYEDYLKKVAELSKQVMAGKADNTPVQLNTPGRLALYNNLIDKSAPAQGIVTEAGNPYISEVGILELAIEIDTQIKSVRSDNWRGNKSKEQQIKAALYGILNDFDRVERIFLIIQQQHEY